METEKEIKVKDKTKSSKMESDDEVKFATADNPYEIGASIPGNIYKILVTEGGNCKRKSKLNDYRSNENGNYYNCKNGWSYRKNSC